MVLQNYINIISDYECIPLLIPQIDNNDLLSEVIDKLDGLLLIGGQDISPSFYGQDCKVIYSSKNIGEPYLRNEILKPNQNRDQKEISLYKLAKSKQIPILGICRGMQLINVAEGGTLHQEIDMKKINHFVESDGWINYHSIEIVKESYIHKLLGCTDYFTSSVHHQAIDSLGDNLCISAIAQDGLIELIESKNESQFIIGIQGHPEQTRKNLNKYESIFKEFINRSKA